MLPLQDLWIFAIMLKIQRNLIAYSKKSKLYITIFGSYIFLMRTSEQALVLSTSESRLPCCHKRSALYCSNFPNSFQREVENVSQSQNHHVTSLFVRGHCWNRGVGGTADKGDECHEVLQGALHNLVAPMIVHHGAWSLKQMNGIWNKCGFVF